MKKPNARVIYKAHDSAEWFTGRSERELACRIFGGFPDLDPATAASNPLQSAVYFTLAQDGLAHSWIEPLERLSSAVKQRPLRLWLNPPYGREIPKWMERFESTCLHFRERLQALALVPARPGSRWYAAQTVRAQLHCELSGRLVFELPDGSVPLGADGRPQPARWGSVLLYRGPNRARVARILRARGVVHLDAPSPRVLAVADPRQLRLLG